MGAELVLFFLLHCVLLGAATGLHIAAAMLSRRKTRKVYHVMAAVVGGISFILALLAIFWTFPTRYAIAVGVAVVTYSVVWILPAVLAIRERNEVGDVVQALNDLKAEVEL